MEENIYRQQVGENIKRFRLKRGLSQTELAQAIGKKSPAYMAFIEKGQRNININDLLLLSAVLKVKIQNLTECEKKI